MKVLIIGLGSIALKHIKALKKVDEKIEIFALRSSKSEVEFDIHDISCIYSFDELNFIPDFIIISNPTFRHFKTIEDLFASKVPHF